MESDGGMMEGDGASKGHFEGTPLCGLEGPLVVLLYSHPLTLQDPPPPPVDHTSQLNPWNQSGYMNHGGQHNNPPTSAPALTPG